jgi:hypothetical protein
MLESSLISEGGIMPEDMDIQIPKSSEYQVYRKMEEIVN